jgi:ATP-dependent protease ClpP protease subunit
MARSDDNRLDLKQLAQAPQVRLLGSVSDEMLNAFQDQLASVAQGDGPVAIEVTSTGGDADIGRRLALEVGLARDRLGRRLVFVGKTIVYSAAATFMGGFRREDRYLTRDAVLLIHCRQLEKKLDLAGPLKASRNRVAQVLGEIENGLLLQEEGYAALIEGSDVSMDEINAKAEDGWYVQAEEAFARGLVAGLI